VTPSPLVHLKLHTGNLARACAFYARLCGWRPERVAGYQAFDWGGDVGAGVVECGTSHAAWLPYVEVSHVGEATGRAAELGASVLLSPREGPAGWRSVVAIPDGAELAFWQPKRRSG
jgi:predicted enzyme related to lactoylglutathione lyase